MNDTDGTTDNLKMPVAKKKSEVSPITPASPVGIKVEADRFYTVAECCEIVGCKRSSIFRYVHERGFPLTGVGQRRAWGADLIAWLNDQRATPNPRRRNASSK